MKNFFQTIKAYIKIGTLHAKIIHKHVNTIFDKINKNTNYASLESSKSIAQIKWHPPIGKSAKETCENGFLLVL